MEDIKKTIGQNINTLLAVKELKQKDLAQALGVPDNTISYYCSGSRKPSYKQLVKIADFFDVTTDTLLGRQGSRGESDALSDAMQYTGLSQKALHEIKYSIYPDILCSMLESKGLSKLLSYLWDYRRDLQVLRNLLPELSEYGIHASKENLSTFRLAYSDMRAASVDAQQTLAGIMEELFSYGELVTGAREVLREISIEEAESMQARLLENENRRLNDGEH